MGSGFNSLDGVSVSPDGSVWAVGAYKDSAGVGRSLFEAITGRLKGKHMGTGIVRPGPDHLGFEVESLDAFKKRLQELGDNNPHLRPRELSGREGDARMKLFAASCSLGEYRFADVDGVLLDVAEKNPR